MTTRSAHATFALAVSAIVASGIVGVSTPAKAATTSIDITTTRATAYGARLQNLTPGGTEGGKPFVFRPFFPLTTTVVCPAGETGVVTSQVWAMFPPQVTFTCTGAPQKVVFPWAAAPNPLGRNVIDVSATLHAAGTSVTDTQTITVITKFSKSPSS